MILLDGMDWFTNSPPVVQAILIALFLIFIYNLKKEDE